MSDESDSVSSAIVACRWRQLSAADSASYVALNRALRTLAGTATAEGKPREAAALDMLANICGMGIQTDSGKGPYEPFMVFEGRRSPLPEDLTVEEVGGLARLAKEPDLPARLRARAADVAWLRTIPRAPQYARLAIDAYREPPILGETFFHGGREELLRAVRLCREIGRDCAERLADIEAAMLAALFLETASAGLRQSLAETLAAAGLGKSKRAEIAGLLEKAAGFAQTEKNFSGARELFLAAARWFAANDADGAVRVTSAAAEMWWLEGEFFRERPGGGNFMAGAAYEAGVQLLRTIPGKYRAALDVEGRIARMRGRLAECHERSLDEMQSYSSEPVDLTKFVEEARARVAQKGAWEGLCAFVQLVPHPPPSHWREQARKSIAESPLSSLFGSTRLSKDGRIVSRSPGLTLGDADSPETQTVIHERAMQSLVFFQGFVAQGGILPALDVLNLEHRPTESDFTSLAHRSPLVPYGREQIFGRALCAGFRRDFGVAVHLLAPQVEHLVRTQISARGGQTRKLDASGVEMEIGLSALMEMPEAEKAFGETIAFELRAIFADAAGSNLRNALAHGLLDDDEMISGATIYAWWFCLRLVMLPMMSPKQRSASEAPVPAEDTPTERGEDNGP